MIAPTPPLVALLFYLLSCFAPPPARWASAGVDPADEPTVERPLTTDERRLYQEIHWRTHHEKRAADEVDCRQCHEPAALQGREW